MTPRLLKRPELLPYIVHTTYISSLMRMNTLGSRLKTTRISLRDLEAQFVDQEVAEAPEPEVPRLPKAVNGFVGSQIVSLVGGILSRRLNRSRKTTEKSGLVVQHYRSACSNSFTLSLVIQTVASLTSISDKM